MFSIVAFQIRSWHIDRVWGVTNPTIQPPLDPNTSPVVPVVPSIVSPERVIKPPVDRIRKHRAQEFRAEDDDDAERAEFWLDNTVRVFNELSYTPDECLKYAISLLRDSAYYWWNTLVSVTAMCRRFEDGLNEDIKLLVGILEINEFVVLVERACKAEELGKEKRKAELESKDFQKRSTSKFLQLATKKRCKPECQQCSRRHFEECWGKSVNRTCYWCGSQDHFIRDCPETVEKGTAQSVRPSDTTARGRPSRVGGGKSGTWRGTSDAAIRSEARVLARAYAIRAREEASSPNVITSIFTLFDTSIIALIDPGSTHSYVCETLVSSKTLPVESTEFVIRVSNPLGRCVLVDRVCKNCPLMIRDSCFPADLMLLPFDEFDIILGMDWLTVHDAIVNYRRKTIDLRCQNNEILRIESTDMSGLPAVISSILARQYLRKGCEAYLAYVIDSKVTEKKIESVPVVCEYSDVFLKELPGLPPICEVEFGIELVPWTAPISIALYRMAPTKLKELKTQLQDLTDRGFTRPSFSPLGAPVLFIKKKEGTLRMCIDYR
ncbi:DNA/RNA polymerases superfamily protein [Gossypium australe]|uniref:DNA/RNA polymerases superfamily protein n=1 Tax=Gossypium australe TaxID=47621 RepID=A0A5B6WRD4_9ROSI|nr:DNA/RNA polymerases superfamily protein [Gossypium australe]